MSTPQESSGLKLTEVFLLSARFEWHRFLEDSPEVDLSNDAIVEYSFFREGQRVDDLIRDTLAVEMKGVVGGVDDWTAMVNFVGAFELKGNDSDIHDRIRYSSVPAILYGYAREHLSDLVRRANLPSMLIPPLPPMTFGIEEWTEYKSQIKMKPH